MDAKDKYQRLDSLQINEMSKSIEELEFDDDFNGTNNSQPSSLDSAPPNDFDINVEPQYVPIFNHLPNEDINNQLSSLASSISAESKQDYRTSPIILTNTCRVIRCPVCEKPMRAFYCAKCIQKGHFVTIDTQTSDNLETKLKQFDSDLSLEDKIEVDEQKVIEETLQFKLRALAKKTETLKILYEDQKVKLEEVKSLVQETKLKLDLDKKSNKSKEGKIELIKKYIDSRKTSVKKRRDAESNLLEDLKQYVSRRAFQLNMDVFPIEEISLMDQNSSINMETSPLLTFSDGSHHQIEQQTAFSIVEPWLPSNGDYSAYSLWVNDNQDHIPASMSGLSERNPAFRIAAGLAFTAQFVKNLAAYLDVMLPARMDFDSFNRELLDDTQFSYNVAKLNANVIHLCVSQGVDVSLLNPQRTLKNLMLLFNLNISDLGRKPIFELFNEETAKSIDEQLTTYLSLVQEEFYNFKFSDEDDISDSEWEISDTINPSEMQLATEQSIQQNSYISRLPLRLFASFWSTGS